MISPLKIESAIKSTHDQSSFINGLLIDTLNWPLSEEAERIEDISYEWTGEELNFLDLDKHIFEGQIWQLQPVQSTQQAWGIFILEFANPDVFIKGRGFTGLLRKVLRGLVPNRRKSSSIPSWRSDNILFICTHKWEHYRFAHFRSDSNEKLARLSTFGWGPGTSNRTACEFNLPELEWPDDDTDKDAWIKKWSKAFDKEELTKQFYKTFADLYYQVIEEVGKTPGLTSRAQEQAQLLLDRLLFLSFLQKKHWLNNESNYLYSRFKECYEKDPAGTSYYGSILCVKDCKVQMIYFDPPYGIKYNSNLQPKREIMAMNVRIQK